MSILASTTVMTDTSAADKVSMGYFDFAVGLRRETPPASEENRLPRRRAAFLVLTGCTALWGANNAATAVALQSFSCAGLVAVRFALATAVILILLALTGRRLKAADIAAGTTSGIALFGTICFFVLAISRSPIASVAIISSLHMVLVPLFEVVLGSSRPRPILLPAVAVAFTGVIVISCADGFAPSLGDCYAFACAISSAAHIILVDRTTRSRDAICTTVGQLATVALLGLGWWVISGSVARTIETGPLAALLFSAVLPGALAMLAMSKYQKRIDTTTACLIYNTEPVWAIAFAIMVGEALTLWTLLGCTLVVTGACIAYLPDRRQSEPVKPVTGLTYDKNNPP